MGIRIDRRQFLATAGAGVASLMFGCNGGGSVSSYSTDPFQPVKLGDSGLTSTLIGVGTGVHGGKRECNYTRMGTEKAVAIVRHSYDMGARFFDSADLYGTHQIMSEAFKSIPREKCILSSKIWFRKGGIPEKERPDADILVDRFRKELKTDYIDLVQLHCAVDPKWNDIQKRQMDILEDLKAKGVIRAHGVSCHSLDALKACVNDPWVDVVHTRVNAYGKHMDDPDPAVVAKVVRDIHNAGKGVIGMKLIGNGDFRDEPDKIEKSLKYVMDLNCTDTLIIGFDTPGQIDNYAERMRNYLQARRENSVNA